MMRDVCCLIWYCLGPLWLGKCVRKWCDVIGRYMTCYDTYYNIVVVTELLPIEIYIKGLQRNMRLGIVLYLHKTQATYYNVLS